MNFRICGVWLRAVPAAAVVMIGMAGVSAHAAEASVVVRDAQSGQMRAPTAEEARSLSPAPSRLAPVRRGMVSGKQNPQQIQRADGAVGMELDESTMSYSVARRNTDGSLSTYCVTSKETAEQLAHGKKAAKNTKESEHAHK
jgi:hypothetical protein